MTAIPTSLLLALRQLADPAILRILAKSMGVTLVLFAGLAWGGWHVVDWGLARAGLEETLFTGAGAARQLAALLLAGIGLWLTWRIVAMAVIGFFADEVVATVEARHYPGAARTAREPPLREQARVSLTAVLRALLVNLAVLPVALALLVTGVGTAALFWLVNGWLVGRELTEMVWLRHRPATGEALPIGAGSRFALGAIVAALLLLPLVGLLAPVLGAAAATHLLHRTRARSLT